MDTVVASRNFFIFPLFLIYCKCNIDWWGNADMKWEIF
ncbi:hypothetical protein LEP1GSC039_2636 [Leptospira santarosai str. 2000027870]|nr:hypothetical protein LEP1GSC039_2636 [Leptospira santarosai str. 2000027870]